MAQPKTQPKTQPKSQPKSQRAAPAPRFYNRELETLAPEDRARLQLQKLQALLQRIYQASPFYRDRFDAAGVSPGDIRSLDDLRRFPTMDKQTLLDDQFAAPPYGKRLCVPEREIRQIHLTSGSTGMGQEVYALTDADLRYSAEMFQYHYTSAGIEPGDVCMHLYPIGTGAAGLSAARAYTEMGANSMLLGMFDSATKLRMAKRFQAHHMLASPAYLTRLTVLCEELGISVPDDFPRLKCITIANESYPLSWIERMRDRWGGLTIHEVFGCTQAGAIMGFTCERGALADGRYGALHIIDHNVLVEVLDPETMQPVAYGEEGEPVITTLERQAVPLVRFRMSDKVRLMPPDSCPCGRTTMIWEAGTVARYDDMIKMKMTNVWPQLVDDVIFAHEAVDEYNGRVYLDEAGRECVSVKLEFKQGLAEGARRADIVGLIARTLKEKTQVTMEVEEAPFGVIERFEFKARRWTDERKTGLDRIKYLDKG